MFVFAVSQLSEHLLDDITWRGAAETVVLLGFVVPLVATQIARGIVTATTAPTPLLRQHYRPEA